MTPMMNNALSKIFYDPSHPGSFGSEARLYREAKKEISSLTLKDVKQFLAQQRTYSIHRPARRNFTRNKMLANYPNHHWQSDLVDMSSFASQNDGFTFILTTIDIFTKKLQAVPIRNKNAQSMVNALSTTFANDKPENLMTDMGTEFLNEPVQKLFRTLAINHFTSRSNSKVKAAVVERVQRTLKSRMFQYFTANGTRRYVEILPKLVNGYNKSYHRSIGMTPNQVTNLNTPLVRARLTSSLPTGSARFTTGDLVRIQHKFGPLDKGYLPNWQEKLFEVVKQTGATKKPMFVLKDELGVRQKSRFHNEELLKAERVPYAIEKILRRDNRNKRVFVKWLGYDSRFNSWISTSAIESIKETNVV